MVARRYHFSAAVYEEDRTPRGIGCDGFGILVRICLMSHDDESVGIETRVGDVLDGIGLPYEVVRIDPAYADTAQFCERYAFPIEQSANTIIVGSKKEPRQYA